MKVINFDIEVPKYKNCIEIAVLGDVHRGNRLFDEELWQQYYIGNGSHKGFKTDSLTYILTTGDLMETAFKESLGVQDQSEWIEDQYMWIRDQLMSVADEGRLIAVIEGNHERRGTRNWIRTTRLLAKDLNVPYAHGYLVINLTLHKGDMKQEYKICAHHGYGWARTEGGKMNSVLRMAQIVGDADAYVMGHLHDKFAKVKPIYINGVRKERLFGMTGSYLKYGGYAEDKLYSPPACGSLKLKFHLDIHRVSGR